MWPDRVSNPGPLTYESGGQPTALRGPVFSFKSKPHFERAMAAKEANRKSRKLFPLVKVEAKHGSELVHLG